MPLLVTAALCSIIHSVDLQPVKQPTSSRLIPIPVELAPRSLQATFRNVTPSDNPPSDTLLGSCPSVPVALTDSDFGNGQYILQAGFAQGESLGATYAVPADQFPIKIDVMEVLFATSNATQETTTEWSVTVWDGTPAQGIQVAHFESDNSILPHLVMPPGSSGIIISVSVDPNDPDQIYIYNESEMNMFSIAFTVEQHNSPGSPCITSPPTSSNAFPCTDTSGLQFPNENWIQAVSGSFCICGTGWMTFQDFPSLCTPSGDWVMRSSYTPVNCNNDPAACCFSDNSCTDLSPQECAVFGGTSQSAGTTCASYSCGSGNGACCVPSTGACVEFDQTTCEVVGGTHMGEGTSCASTTCFPEGACCLIDGTCIGPVSDDDCLAVGGAFMGDSTSCSTTSCPQPIGACCGSGWCLDLTNDDCTAVGGAWQGMQTFCSDSSICDSDCPEDLDGDGVVNVNDILAIVGSWGSSNSNNDLDGSGIVDTGDLLAVIGTWGPCE
ncbi:MAG: hypothetical protein HOK75_08695 [Phycisphaerae bacterium]|nr:hypothetical protein [Phycisphaerae bacterium]